MKKQDDGFVEDRSENKKLNEMLNRIELSPEISAYGESIRQSVHDEVDRRINRYARRIRLYRLSAVAACAAVVFLFSYEFFFTHPAVDMAEEKNALLSQLAQENTHIEEVQIISGTDQKTINNDETIVQTEKGDILVGKEGERVETNDAEAKYITVVVPRGKRSTLHFSEGSVAYINSGTKLSYPKTFEGKTRDIFLDGEIYIDVAKNAGMPFRVHTKSMDVEVLGTVFNVNAYSDDEDSNSVVLVEGSVVVNANDKRSMLKPNQGYFNDNGTSTIKNVDVYPYICWKNGILKVEGETFEELSKKLSRYYGVEITLAGSLKGVTFDGSLNLRDSLEDVLRMLSISKSFSYQILDDRVYIE